MGIRTFLENYGKLTRRDRALLDGKLITYHFHVGGATLLLLGVIGLAQGEYFSWVAVVFGLVSFAMGAGLASFHKRMIAGPNRDGYLVTISAALGRYPYPLIPLLLGGLIVFSLVVTLLYLLAS